MMVEILDAAEHDLVGPFHFYDNEAKDRQRANRLAPRFEPGFARPATLFAIRAIRMIRAIRGPFSRILCEPCVLLWLCVFFQFPAQSAQFHQNHLN